MIKNAIDILREKQGCIIFDKTTVKDLDHANTFLHQNNFANIPKEYEELLNLTNGIIYNGLEFFGTTYHHREEKNYYFPDIMTINKHYKKYSFFEHKLIIGRLSESIIMYDRKTDSYALIDRIKLRPRIETENLENLLETVINIISI